MPRFTSERPSASVATTRPSFTPTLTPQPVPQNRQGAFDHLSFAASASATKVCPVAASGRAVDVAAVAAALRFRKSRRDSVIVNPLPGSWSGG
jgi:hypothetical protein